ncbi:MAG: hypothetical protein LBB84_09905 [Tannerellaceae bacterium]|jgi:hypothetical protein|nr:hypothetical protein [Tannerellaceae bacterium]
MRTHSIYFILLFALLSLGGCADKNSEEEENIEGILEPSQRILGQWQEIACGNEYNPELPPTSQTIEFFSGGTYYGAYGFHNGWNVGKADYQIASDSLILSREGSRIHIYRYIFIGKKQLLVDHIYGDVPYVMTIPKYHIFERINTQKP